MNTRYLINMDDGRIEFRDEWTDKQVNLRPIPDNVVDMIKTGELNPRDVVNAIGKKLKDSDDFDFNEYINERKKLNVRSSFKSTFREKKEALRDRSAEEVTVAEVVSLRDKSGKKEKSKAKSKAAEALSSDMAFPFGN